MSHFAAKTADTRTLILKTMYDLVWESGYRKVNMEDVAQAAGISRATIYAYFKDKEELMMAVLAEANEADRRHLREIVHSKGSPEERIFKFLEGRVMRKVARCQDTKASIDDLIAVARPRLLSLRQETMKIDVGLLAELLIEGKLAGDFQFENAMTVGESFLLATNCFMPFSLTPEELGDEDSLKLKLHAMIAMCLASIRSAKGHPSEPRHWHEGHRWKKSANGKGKPA